MKRRLLFPQLTFAAATAVVGPAATSCLPLVLGRGPRLGRLHAVQRHAEGTEIKVRCCTRNMACRVMWKGSGALALYPRPALPPHTVAVRQHCACRACNARCVLTGTPKHLRAASRPCHHLKSTCTGPECLGARSPGTSARPASHSRAPGVNACSSQSYKSHLKP
jgi:hypothetical protein